MTDVHGRSHAADHDGLVCCLVGDEQFALRTSEVRVIARAEDMRPERGRQRVGTVTFGRQQVPVYSLAGLLGWTASTRQAGSHVVVTEGAHGAHYGLLVDRVVRSGHIDRVDVLPLPSAIVGPVAARWFEGLARLGELWCAALCPEGLDPAAPTRRSAGTGDPGREVLRPRAPAANEMVVIFSTDALPPCGERRVAFNARRIAAVVQTLPSVALPGAPPYLRRVAPWRRVAVPIVDFAVTGARRANGRSLVVRTADGAFIGLPVDADLTVHRVTAEDTRLADGATPFVSGVFGAGAERVALLDFDALLSAHRQAFIAECAV